MAFKFLCTQSDISHFEKKIEKLTFSFKWCKSFHSCAKTSWIMAAAIGKKNTLVAEKEDTRLQKLDSGFKLQN